MHSSVDGYLDCFHPLAVLNSAVMNIYVHVLVFTSGCIWNRSKHHSYTVISFFFCGSAAWFVGSQFPDQGLNQAMVVKTWNPNH